MHIDRFCPFFNPIESHSCTDFYISATVLLVVFLVWLLVMSLDVLKESHDFSQKWWRRKGACGSMPYFFFCPELCTVMCFVHFSSYQKSQFYWFYISATVLLVTLLGWLLVMNPDILKQHSEYLLSMNNMDHLCKILNIYDWLILLL